MCCTWFLSPCTVAAIWLVLGLSLCTQLAGGDRCAELAFMWHGLRMLEAGRRLAGRRAPANLLVIYGQRPRDRVDGCQGGSVADAKLLGDIEGLSAALGLDVIVCCSACSGELASAVFLRALLRLHVGGCATTKLIGAACPRRIRCQWLRRIWPRCDLPANWPGWS